MDRDKIFKIAGMSFLVIVALLIGGYFYLTHTKGVPDKDPGAGGYGGLVDNTGGTNNQNATSTQNNNNGGTATSSRPIPRLRKIYATPIAGADLLSSTTSGSKISINIVDRGNGNVYETAPDTLDIQRITNTTIPKVEQAFFGNSMNNVLLRYTNEKNIVQTFLGFINTGDSSLTGNFFKDIPQDIALSPGKNKFFYTKQDGSGSSWNISDFKGKITNITSNPLKGWLYYWPNENFVIIQNKPSALAGSVSYELNLKSGSLTKLIGPQNGLLTLASSDLTYLAYSYNQDNTPTFSVLNLKKGETKTFGQRTLVDKCVWNNEGSVIYCGVPSSLGSGLYPDDWYKGTVSFTDNLYSFDVSTGTETLVSNLQSEGGEPIDATNLKISKDGSYLIFTNKKDLSLWGYKLVE